MRSSLHGTSVVFLVILSAGCAALRPAGPDAGVIDKGIYRNAYFGFALPIPPGAQATSAVQAADLKKESVKTAADPKIARDADASLTMLLALYAKPSARKTGDGVAITVGAVKISPEMGFKDAADYVRKAAEQLKPGQPAGPPASARIGGEEFAAQEMSVSLSGEPVFEKLHALFRKGYAFIITSTYGGAAGRKRAEGLLGAAKFETPKGAGI